MARVLLFLFLFFGNNLLFSAASASEFKNWQGKLDQNGRAEIAYDLSAADFLLQAFVFYHDNWRQTPVFWQKGKIWFELGPQFRDTPYRIQLLLPTANQQ